MADSESGTRHIRLHNRGDTWHITQDVNNSADLNSARHGKFQEKEKTPTTELFDFLSKKLFGGKQ